MSQPLDRITQKLDKLDALLKQSAQRKRRSGLREELLDEVEHSSDAALEKVLDFLRFLNYEERELQQDLADARAAVEEAKQEGTISLSDLKRELGL